MQRVTPHGSRTLAPKNAIKEKWFRIIIIQILQVNDAASSVRVLNKNGCVRSSRGQSKYNHCWPENVLLPIRAVNTEYSWWHFMNSTFEPLPVCVLESWAHQFQNRIQDMMWPHSSTSVAPSLNAKQLEQLRTCDLRKGSFTASSRIGSNWSCAMPVGQTKHLNDLLTLHMVCFWFKTFRGKYQSRSAIPATRTKLACANPNWTCLEVQPKMVHHVAFSFNGLITFITGSTFSENQHIVVAWVANPVNLNVMKSQIKASGALSGQRCWPYKTKCLYQHTSRQIEHADCKDQTQGFEGLLLWCYC